MNRKLHSGVRRCLRGMFPGALATLVVTSGVSGQTAAPAPQIKEEVTQLEKFVVTGSNIPTASDAVAVPVTVIGQTQIDKTGINANLLEVIRKRLPFFAGNGNLGNTNANVGGNSTLGGSQGSLRNLDTLVLINGRRVATSGANGRGGRNFVDLNLIPVAAIERLEVLTDGASAIYGSDAVGGVINIILRKNMNGGEAGFRYGVAKGGYSEQSGYALVGANNDRVSATVSATWSKTEPLLQKDRSFSGRIIGRTAGISGAVGQGTAFPTHFLATGVNAPRERVPTGTAATRSTLAELVTAGVYAPATFQSVADSFDIAPYATLILDQEQSSAVANFNFELTPEIELFSDLMYANTRSASQLAAQPATGLTVPAGSPFNPLTVAMTQVAARFVDNPRGFFNDADFIRATVGARGKIGDKWNWEGAYVYNESSVEVRTQNVLYAPNLTRAIAGGYDAAGNVVAGGAYSRVITGFSESSTNFVVQPALDVLARGSGINPASLANILGTSVGNFANELKAIDFKVAGTPYTLPSGDIGIALGAGVVNENLSGIPDENSRNTGPTRQRWSGATFFDPFSKKREVKSYFGEVRVPLTGNDWNLPGVNRLDLTAAFRWDDYNDAGKSDVPKYGLAWRPFDEQLTIRYTYSESFSAPTLFALSGPTTQGFTATNVIPNVFGVNGQAQSRGGSNPNLRPSTAETNYFGFVVSPRAIKGLTVTVDYVDIDQVDLVGGIGVATILQSVEQQGPASPYAAQAGFGNFPGESGYRAVTRAGELGDFLRAGNSANAIYLFDGNVNIAGQKVRALDVNVEYSMKTESMGKFDFSTTGTFFLDYQFQALPSQRYYEYAGHTTNGGTGSQGTLPGYRFYSSVQWDMGDWSALLGNTYIPEVTDIGTGGIGFATSTTLTRRAVDAYIDWDLQLSYRVKSKSSGSALRWLDGMVLTAGVNNLLDEGPPLAPQAWNESNVDISTYGVVGRLVFIKAGMKF
ncbi:MAG: TonB-dependent receptor [Opitutaceae bacterium]|nr:TonB-dependent receptor [Opitutaceae bacterium]